MRRGHFASYNFYRNSTLFCFNARNWLLGKEKNEVFKRFFSSWTIYWLFCYGNCHIRIYPKRLGYVWNFWNNLWVGNSSYFYSCNSNAFRLFTSMGTSRNKNPKNRKSI